MTKSRQSRAGTTTDAHARPVVPSFFRREVSAIANVIDFFRIAVDYDYLLKFR